MKLMQVINGLGAGGAERSLAELLPFYLAAGIDTTVVCIYGQATGVEQYVRSLDCRVEILSKHSRLDLVRPVRKLIRDVRPDLVHTTLYYSHVIGRFAAARTGVPVLSSLVNTPYEPERAGDPNLNRAGFRMVRAIDGWTARHLTAHFHAITHAVRDSYIARLGLRPERITVVERGRAATRLGEPGEERKRRVRGSLGIAADAEVLINVGRQVYQKGQTDLLEAFARLVERRPGTVLLIAGREGERTQVLREAQARLGLGDRVRFLGFRTDVADLLAASDLFVFPSLYEGLGGGVIEAMALGLPVIASDIPALREVVDAGVTGELVEPGSPVALASAIEAMLDDPARRAACAERAMERFRERFTIERSAARMIEMYRAVVARAGRATARAPVPAAAVSGAARP